MKPEVPDRSGPVPAATDWLGRWGLFPIVGVTALIAASVAVPLMLRDRTVAPSAVRGTTPDISIEAPTSGPGVVSFRWRAVPSADGYRVQVSSADGVPVWTSPVVHEPQVDWPGAKGDATYFWRVTALRANDVVAESPGTTFTVHR